jgi:hypothetical protein
MLEHRKESLKLHAELKLGIISRWVGGKRLVGIF